MARAQPRCHRVVGSAGSCPPARSPWRWFWGCFGDLRGELRAAFPGEGAWLLRVPGGPEHPHFTDVLERDEPGGARSRVPRWLPAASRHQRAAPGVGCSGKRQRGAGEVSPGAFARWLGNDELF